MKSLHVKIPWFLQTMEPRFNEPIYNEVLGIKNDFLQPGQNYNKMYGPEPLFNEILLIKDTIQKRNHKIYFDVTNKCEHVIKKMKAKQTNKDKFMCTVVLSSFVCP